MSVKTLVLYRSLFQAKLIQTARNVLFTCQVIGAIFSYNLSLSNVVLCKLEKCIARFSSRVVCCCNMLYKGKLVECILRATYNTAGNTCDNIFQLPTQHCRATMPENIASITWQVNNTFLPTLLFDGLIFHITFSVCVQ